VKDRLKEGYERLNAIISSVYFSKRTLRSPQRIEGEKVQIPEVEDEKKGRWRKV
jgi:hypothetical protein